MRYSVPSLIAILYMFGCAAESDIRWTHPQYDAGRFETDRLACESNGNRVAGPVPQSRPKPKCVIGFSCGLGKGSVTAANARARETWVSAFTVGFQSCMFERGYLRSSR